MWIFQTVFNTGSSPGFSLNLPIIISSSFFSVWSILFFVVIFHGIHQSLLQYLSFSVYTSIIVKLNGCSWILSTIILFLSGLYPITCAVIYFGMLMPTPFFVSFISRIEIFEFIWLEMSVFIHFLLEFLPYSLSFLL